MSSTRSGLPRRLKPRAHHFPLEARQLFDGAAFVEAASADAPGAPAEVPPEAAADHGAAAPDAHPVTTQQDVGPAHTETPPVQVYVVDGSVADRESLVASLPAGSQVIVLATDRSGTAQIAEALAGQSNIGALHILSHGTAEGIVLGNQTLDAATLSAAQADLDRIGSALTADGDILLYGCDVAASDTAFIDRLATLTQADVAASTDATGHAARGGNWTLEASSGSIEATAFAAMGYDALLAAPTVNAPGAAYTVVEPSSINAPGASSVNFSGWSLADDGAGNVTVTVLVDSNGDLLGDTTVGSLTVGGVGAGAGTLTFTGSAAAADAWLKSIVFTASDTELGVTAATATIRVTVTDSEATPLSTTRTLGVTVTPSNDPVSVANNSQNVDEIVNTVITPATLAAIDAELALGTQTPAQIIFGVTGLPQHGYLMRDGTRLGVDSIFTYQDVLDGKIVYVHTATGADQNTADGFSIRVNDGATPTAQSDTATITLNITPVNQGPSVSGSGVILEGQPANALDASNNPISVVGNLIVADGGGDDDLSTLMVRLTSLPTDGTLFFTGTAIVNGVTMNFTNEAITLAYVTTGTGFQFSYAARGGLTYGNTGNRDGDGNPATDYAYTDGFGVTVTDGGGGTGVGASASTTISLTVQPVNDDPVWDEGSTRSATVTDNVSYTVTLTDTMLNASDVDSGEERMTFVITSDTTRGVILLNGEILPLGGSFTLDDVRNGRVEYVQVSGAGPGEFDQFSFSLVDNSVSIRWNADGTSIERLGGVYVDGGTPGNFADDALRVFTFDIGLLETPAGNGGAFPDRDLTVTDVSSNFAGTDNLNETRGGGLVEGGSILLTGNTGPGDAGLHYSVGNIPANQTVYTILGFEGGSAAGWNGTLERFTGGSWVAMNVYDTFTQDDLDNSRVRYTHDGGEDFESSVRLSASAGVNIGGAVDRWETEFKFFVTPANDAPVIVGSSSSVIPEGGTAYITTGQLGISDADDATSEAYYEAGTTLAGGGDNFAYNNDATGPDALRFVVSTLPTGGTLQYSLDGGSSWQNVVAGVTVIPANVLTGNAGTTGLRFVSSGDETRTTSFDVSALDRWDASSGTATVTIQITNVNDAPRIATDPTQADPGALPGEPAGTAVNEPLIIPEGTRTQITTAFLSAYDPDSTTAQVQFRITGTPTEGTLLYSTDGVTFRLLGVGSSFTQADVMAGRVYYQHAGGESAPATYPGTPNDKFTFTISDGDKEQNNNEFWIYTTETNDAPTVSVSGPTTIHLDNAGGADPVGGFSVGDVDIADGNTDVMQVVVRLLQDGGTPFTAAQYTGVTLAASVAGGGVATGGTNDYLVLRGTREQINDALETLTVTFSSDRDAAYRVQVIADDRVRDAGTGALVDSVPGGAVDATANGGANNQNGGSPALVPNTDGFNWYGDGAGSVGSTGIPPGMAGNIGANTVRVFASSENDVPTFTGPPDLEVYEDQSLFIGGNFTIGDAESEAFGTSVSVSFSIPVGQGTLSIGALGGVTVDSSVVGGNQVLTLTGRADLIESLVTNPASGLRYTTPAGGNIDYNGTGTSGSVTLTVQFNEGASAIGDAPGGGASVPNVVAPLVIPITIVPVNDAPTVSAGSGAQPLVGTTPVGGFVVGDVDINGDIDADPGTLDVAAGETDFVQVTVRILDDATGNPLVAGDYVDMTDPLAPVDNIVISSSAPGNGGVTVDTTFDGTGSALVIRGTLAEVNAYLAGLQVKIEGPLANIDANYRVQVIADDRVRDRTTGALGVTANGGDNPATGGGVQLPSTGEIDPYLTAGIPAPLAPNVNVAQRIVFPTTLNDPGQVTVPGTLVVDEGSATVTLNGTIGNITLFDPDAGVANTMTATVSVPTGFTFNSVGGTAAVTGVGTGTVVLTGSQDQINASLKAMVINLPDEPDAPTPSDWNGSFDVTIVYDDKGNTGVRPDVLGGDSNDPTSANGDYEYTDTAPGSTDNALTTTRVFTITVNAVNDAPQLANPLDTVVTIVPSQADRPADAGGQSVNTLFAGQYADPLDPITGGSASNTFHGVAVVGPAANPAEGAWEYQIDGTGPWIAVGSRTDANALVLDGNDRLRFVPAGDFNGTPAPLTVRLVETGDGGNSTVAPTGGTTLNIAGATGGTSRYSTGTLTLTTSVAPLSLTVTDGNGGGTTGEATVYEQGLTDGGGSQTATGTFVLNVPDGIDRITVGGTDITLGQLTGLPGTPLAPIATPMGTITITSYDPATGTVGYRYTLITPQTHGVPEVTKAIAVSVTDTDGDTVGGTVTVLVIDDSPAANDDRASVQLGGPSATVGGNVLTGGGAGDVADRPGADGPTTVTALAGGIVGTPLPATYGTLTLNADGSYSFAVNTEHPAVKDLYTGQTLVETFTYTITDADGDTSTATLTITILGPDNRMPPIIFPGLDQFDPPVIYQPFEPAVFVQLSVAESAQLIQSLSAQIGDGQGIEFGAEIQSELLAIDQDMTNTQHVSRDGVAFSKQLLAEGQSRARGLGNSMVVGASTLFDDFSPFGPNPVNAGEETAQTADAGTAGQPVQAADASGADTDAGGTAQRDAFIADLEALQAEAQASIAAPRGATPFSEQLAAMAGRQGSVKDMSLAAATQKARPVKVPQAVSHT
ncbi:DUF4347 domain-containing protein [Variovorax sp. VNK109]|uniref:DUF4347 domain-containing protein n=1 Tax=Variovorax sp. VNK109 TaxID=3400919 RepID=UPI003BFE0558